MPTQEEGEYRPCYPAPVKVHVAVGPRTQPFDECMDSLNQAIQVAASSGFKVTFEKVRRGCPGFQNAAPVLCHFMQSNATHLFIAADDVIFPPDTIVRLVNDNKDIVSGIYRKNVLAHIEPANHCESPDKFMECLKQGGVYETEFGASHSMTIKRAVIEKMIGDYPELHFDAGEELHYGLFLPMIRDRQPYQDDWAFSIRARQSGFTIWNDFGCRLKHFCSDFLGFEALEAMHA